MKICDSENVIEEIRQIFLDDAPRSIEFIANAIKTKNIKDIEFYAHRLKGSARCVTAEQLFDQTNRLEQAGREKDMVTAASVFHDVKAQYEKVRSFLSQPNWIEIAKQQENNKQIIPSWS